MFLANAQHMQKITEIFEIAEAAIRICGSVELARA